MAGATIKWSLPELTTLVLLDGNGVLGYDWQDVSRFLATCRLKPHDIYDWHEPDIDNQCTAIAISPNAYKIKFLEKFPLLFAEGGEINGRK